MSSSRRTSGVVVSGDELAREGEQAVGLAAHRRGNDDELVARPRPLGDAARDALDPLRRAHRGAAVLVNDQCHGRKARVAAAARTRHARARERDSSQRPSRAPRLPVGARRGSQVSATCGLAWRGDGARIERRARRTNTGTPSRQTIGPSRSAGATPARLELQLQAARRPAGAGLEAIAGRARAQLEARGASRPAMPPAATALDAKRTAPRGDLVTAGRGSGRRRIGARLAPPRQSAHVDRSAAGRGSCAARRPAIGQRRCGPDASASCISRSTRLAGGGAPSSRAQPAHAAPGAGAAATGARQAARSRPLGVGDGGEVERGDLVEHRRGVAGRARRRRRAPPRRRRTPRRAPARRAGAGDCARSASSSLLSSSIQRRRCRRA